MYSIYDYAYNGLLYLNNIVRPRHKRLSQLMIYSTTACQSRCKHCNIWQKPVEHLSLDDIKRVMQSRCVTKRTTVGLYTQGFFNELQAFVNAVEGRKENIFSSIEATRETYRLIEKLRLAYFANRLDDDSTIDDGFVS